MIGWAKEHAQHSPAAKFCEGDEVRATVAIWGMHGAYLKDSSEESSGVGEAGQPVADGVALVYPALQLV